MPLVTKLFADYGLITDGSGVDTYFHQNAVLGSMFEALKIGTEVRFVYPTARRDLRPVASTLSINTGGSKL